MTFLGVTLTLLPPLITYPDSAMFDASDWSLPGLRSHIEHLPSNPSLDDTYAPFSMA